MISSFSWFSKDQDYFLTLTDDNKYYRVCTADYVPFDFSYNEILSIGRSKGIIYNFDLKQFDANSELNASFDISQIMKERALKNYGLSKDFLSNVQFCGNNKELIFLWQWLDSKTVKH
jgi:hypothetical protein